MRHHWEYMASTVKGTFGAITLDCLQKHGAEGWELVSVTRHPEGDFTNDGVFCFWFKREKMDATPYRGEIEG